ncbi:MAG: hypothetical protein ACI4GB_05490 [Acutalibacteraceae bacterium]
MTEGINRVLLKGKILHIYEVFGKNVIIVTIGTGDTTANVTIDKNLANYFRQNYTLHDYIGVEGSIQNGYSKPYGVKDTIIVTKILDEKEYDHREYINHFDIYGTVKNVVELNHGKLNKININVVYNGYISTVPVTFYNKDYRLNAETGEPIRVSGTIVTNKTENKHYQNYVANEII